MLKLSIKFIEVPFGVKVVAFSAKTKEILLTWIYITGEIMENSDSKSITESECGEVLPEANCRLRHIPLYILAMRSWKWCKTFFLNVYCFPVARRYFLKLYNWARKVPVENGTLLPNLTDFYLWDSFGRMNTLLQVKL